MNRRGPNRHPYWLLAGFVGLMSVPLPWAIAALTAAYTLQATIALTRARAKRRRERAYREALGPTLHLGSDPQGREVVLGDRQLDGHGLIVGATGAGKTTTLLTILTDRIERGLPVVAIDLKGSRAFAQALESAAARANRPFRIWTPNGPSHWNPLAHGNATELKDKLISTERFTEPHYKKAAERYAQTALQVLQATGRRPQLADVVALMEPRRLAVAARDVVDEELRDRVQSYVPAMSPDQVSAVRGLATRLAIMSESDAGRWLNEPVGPGMPAVELGSTPAAPAVDLGSAPGAPAIDLRAALDQPGVVLFSLNSSVDSELAAQVGTLAIQDIVSAQGHRLEHGWSLPATVAVDEFSVLGGTHHLLALHARGREPGISSLLVTQEFADLEKLSRPFRDQLLGLTGVKIAHRQDVYQSALMMAQLVGTEWVPEFTEHVRGPFAPAGSSRGTRRLVERFIVHPNEIMTLPPGEAIVLTKTPVARVTRVRVTAPTPPAHGRTEPSARPHGEGRVTPGPGIGPADRSGPPREPPREIGPADGSPTPREPPRAIGPGDRSSAERRAPGRDAPRRRGIGRGDQPDRGVTR